MNPYIKCIRGDSSYKVPTWADGTDEEIAEALTKHYNDEIDLNDYWTVGDERVVHLSAIDGSSYSLENQEAQNVTLVLLNVGGKELVTSINGHTECAFIVGQKDCLSDNGQIYSGNSNNGWSDSNRRSWCNDAYKNAIPSTLRGIFKEHINWASNFYNANYSLPLQDYFCLPARNEVIGVSDSHDYSTSKNPQLEYYKTASNRIKKANGVDSGYWTSSKYYTTSSAASVRRRMFYIWSDGNYDSTSSYTLLGIAPQGVI